MKTKAIFTTLLILLTFNFVSGQDKNIKEKLNQIKEAKKIVVTTDKGDVIFEGDEAEKLLQRMKSKDLKKRIQIISDDDKIITENIEGLEDDNENIFYIKSDSCHGNIIEHKGKGKRVLMFKSDDGDFDKIEKTKTVKVQVEGADDEKTVTVTTKENGDENVEVYEGKEADDYLEKMKDGEDMKIEINEDEDGDSMSIWVEKGDSVKNKIEKNVNVEEENGVKKVTVKTIENGKEKVETFVGDEAEKYLEKEKIDSKGKKEIRKKIIVK